jgi:hypothetical protein
MAQMKQIIDGLKSSMDQLSAPFPVEPIGPGAKWDVLATVEANGMKVLSAITYTLASVDGERGRLELTMKQTAPDQVVKMPGMPSGAKARLIKMETTGSGAGDFDLGNPLALKLKSSAKSQMEMEVEAMGDKQEMSMDMDMTITLQPTALPPAAPKGDASSEDGVKAAPPQADEPQVAP